MTRERVDLDQAQGRIDRAHTEIGEIAAQTPAKRWRMSIPAQPERDSDLLISRALDDGSKAIAELRAAREVIKAGRKLAEWVRRDLPTMDLHARRYMQERLDGWDAAYDKAVGP